MNFANSRSTPQPMPGPRFPGGDGSRPTRSWQNSSPQSAASDNWNHSDKPVRYAWATFQHVPQPQPGDGSHRDPAGAKRSLPRRGRIPATDQSAPRTRPEKIGKPTLGPACRGFPVPAHGEAGSALRQTGDSAGSPPEHSSTGCLPGCAPESGPASPARPAVGPGSGPPGKATGHSLGAQPESPSRREHHDDTQLSPTEKTLSWGTDCDLHAAFASRTPVAAVASGGQTGARGATGAP